MKIVSPFRPFEAESNSHKRLGPFDWVGALRMLGDTAARYGNAQVFAITDVDTDLPVPAYHYHTTHRRLMVWILDVCACYLESDDFDQDTAMMSPDILLFGDLRKWFTADLGIIVRLRPKYFASGKVLLNSVQFWRHSAKPQLAAFYREAVAIAAGLPEPQLRWGADTVPLVQLLSPLENGIIDRCGMRVRCIDEPEFMCTPSDRDLGRLAQGLPPDPPPLPLVDFKNARKLCMRQYYEAMVPQAVPA